ncbi:PTS sugar transporter subunit IIC [Macrococcoides goetzii]|uniref:PTS sugar transporter subunit IIC n=1 Tax=Macrococcoides goetzii TaxID=1891097 RepID=A0A2G5NRV2_9STAP|nr:PTS sugar transporter subunit IIC [Macrococcus goetzii]RAI82883.1 PTS sugar transporter subunit IIC [Macrococcus goetzii]
MEKLSAKQFTMNVLNGLAIGAVIVLIPGALLGELIKALLPSMPFLAPVLGALSMSNAMMGLVVGMMVGMNFKFNPIQSASLGLATMFASGAVQFGEQGAMSLKGTGDVINMGITAALGAGLILLIGNSLKAYTILVIPALILSVIGFIGRLLLPHVMQITALIGKGVASLLHLQPIVMCILLAIIFGVLIVSPITTVGIALAISLAGVGSGAANVGICATGFGFAILGWSVNTRGTSLAHFIGSPKMSMANVAKKPIILLPIICSAACCGLIAAILNIVGTPMSAGFGFSGLVGPINYLNLAEGGWNFINFMKTLIAFIIAPVGFGFLFKYVFTKLVPIVKVEDYYLDI